MTFVRGAVVTVSLLGALLTVMVVLLFLMLGSLNQVESDLDHANGQLERTNGRIGDLNELLDRPARLSPEVLRRARPFLRVTRSDLDTTTERTARIENVTAAIADATLPLAQNLLAADVPQRLQTVASVAVAFADLMRRAPLAETVAASRDALVALERLDLLDDADRAFRRISAVPRRLSTVTEVLDSVVLIQCRMLEHIRSIDRKTGGEVGDPGPDRPPRPCRAPEREG